MIFGKGITSIYNGDCRDVLPTLDLVDAVVTDPPYGLSFMGKGWDRGIPGVEFWEAVMGAMKPGAHLLAFGGTRTFHRLTCAIEDAGFEIRDCLMWVYGSGFPKSLDVSKAIDKSTKTEREVVGSYKARGFSEVSPTEDGRNQWAAGEVIDKVGHRTVPATDAAKEWEGWGTALKPAWEPIILARKPLEGTVANNVLEHGVGGLNIDGCRVGTDVIQTHGSGDKYANLKTGQSDGVGEYQNHQGRWPANLIHDGSDEVVELFPNTAPSKATPRNNGEFKSQSKGAETAHVTYGHSDRGSAARFFYCAKASKKDRGEGNNHATVKPTELMRYLCRLITPPSGVILDPFMGSGSTLVAAQSEGLSNDSYAFNSIGIDIDESYCEIAVRRLNENNA